MNKAFSLLKIHYSLCCFAVKWLMEDAKCAWLTVRVISTVRKRPRLKHGAPLIWDFWGRCQARTNILKKIWSSKRAAPIKHWHYRATKLRCKIYRPTVYLKSIILVECGNQILVTKICNTGRISYIWTNFIQNSSAQNHKRFTCY